MATSRDELEKKGYDFDRYGIFLDSPEWVQSVEDCISIMREEAGKCLVHFHSEPERFIYLVGLMNDRGYFPDQLRYMTALLLHIQRSVSKINTHYWYGLAGYQTI